MTRLFEVKDADACRKIVTECLGVDNEVTKHFVREGYFEEQAEKFPFFVHEVDGRVVAMGATNGHEIKRMYISPEFQKQGIGTELLSFLEEGLKKSGRVRWLVHATEDSIDFYKKHNYQFIGNYMYLNYQKRPVKTYEMIKEIK